MDSVSTMQAAVRQELGEMIQSKGIMDVQRYNALNKIINDPAQLETAKATPEEIAFVKEVVIREHRDFVGGILCILQEITILQAIDFPTKAV